MKKILKIICFIYIVCFALCFYACNGDSVYTVTFDADGGTLSFYEEKVELAGDVTLPTGEKAGYKLACFIYTYDGNEYLVGQDKYYFRKDITVKAIWAPEDSYIINYRLDGGYFSGSGVYYYSENCDDITLPYPVKPGYRFMGFKENGEGDAVKPSIILHGSKNDKTFDAVFSEAEYTVRLVLTCEAQSAARENYTEQVACTYHGASEHTLTVAYGYAIDLDEATPEQKNYSFLCWLYRDKNGELKELPVQGQDGAIIFNEDNFEYGKEVVLYVCCVPILSIYV